MISMEKQQGLQIVSMVLEDLLSHVLEEDEVINIEEENESSQDISPYLKARDDRVAAMRAEFHLLFPNFGQEVLDMKSRKTVVMRKKGQPCQVVPRKSSRIQNISHTERVLNVEEVSQQQSAESDKEVLVYGDNRVRTDEFLEFEGFEVETNFQRGLHTACPRTGGLAVGGLHTGVVECGGMDFGGLVNDGKEPECNESEGLVAGGLVDGGLLDGGMVDASLVDSSLVDGSLRDGGLVDGSLGDGSPGDGSPGDGSPGDGSPGDGSLGDRSLQISPIGQDGAVSESGDNLGNFACLPCGMKFR